MVMMGFKPSFFLFLFIVELPFADAAGAVAPCGGCCCASVSLVCSAPVMVREKGFRRLGSQNGRVMDGRGRVAVLVDNGVAGVGRVMVGKGKVEWRGLSTVRKVKACPDSAS